MCRSSQCVGVLHHASDVLVCCLSALVTPALRFACTLLVSQPLSLPLAPPQYLPLSVTLLLPFTPFPILDHILFLP